jgi:glutathione S-transferase
LQQLLCFGLGNLNIKLSYNANTKTMSSFPPAPTGPLVLYDHPVSSYAQKLRIALREKSLPFTAFTPADMMQPASSGGPLSKVNPRMEVPVLAHSDPSTGDDVTLFDSTVIMEYLEERWPETTLLPQRPAERAKMRLIEEVVDTQYEAVNWGIAEVRWYRRAEGKSAEELERNGRHHTKVLQEWLTTQLGEKEYFGGDKFGWADCAVAPIVNRSVTYGLGPEEGSRLKEWHSRVKQRESVKATFAEYEEMMAKMPNLADVFKRGERKREYRDHRLEWMIKAGGLEVVREGLERGNVRFSWPDNP